MDWNDKYGEAIGAFWGASVFVGALASIILGFICNFNWLPAILIGTCVFLITGLTLQGIITLTRKEKKKINK